MERKTLLKFVFSVTLYCQSPRLDHLEMVHIQFVKLLKSHHAGYIRIHTDSVKYGNFRSYDNSFLCYVSYNTHESICEMSI